MSLGGDGGFSGFVHACIASSPCVQQYISSVLDICYVDTSLTWFTFCFLTNHYKDWFHVSKDRMIYCCHTKRVRKLAHPARLVNDRYIRIIPVTRVSSEQAAPPS